MLCRVSTLDANPELLGDGWLDENIGRPGASHRKRQIGILSSCVSIQATRQCCPPCWKECNPSKSESAGDRLLVCCRELLRIRSSPSRATGVRPYKCAVSSLLLPVSAVLAVFRGIEAVAPPGYRIHRDPHAGAVPIRRMSNVTHPPRIAHPRLSAESACLTVVPLRDHVPINRIPRDSGAGTVVTAWPF